MMRLRFAFLALAVASVVAAGCGGDSRPRSDGGGGGGDGGGTDGGGGGGCGSLTMCGTECVDTRYDPNNCGACGTVCGAGEVCSGGTCAGGCGTGTVMCGDRCADTRIDPENCGMCGNACGASEVCSMGTCDVSCVGGTVDCGGSCVDTRANVSHCGGCDIRCDPGEACFDGACGMRPTVDTDGDTISDFDELASVPRDTDGDMTPDYMDTDSDGDSILDAMEAGDTNVMTPPVDSDGDRTPDFQDTDSDNDGLSDRDEATVHMTDPTLRDSDGDGESDSVEVMGGSNPRDPMSTIGGMGGFAFDLPYMGTPRTNTLTFTPRIQKADVFFLVDTTGSMGGTISGLQTSLSSLVTSIRGTIPDTAFGVGRHDDFPTGSYGSTGDVPFGLLQRMTTNMTDISSGVSSLSLHYGNDGPESQIEGLYQAATGAGFRSPSGTYWTPAFSGMTGYDATRGHGLIGGAGFRRDSLPIIVLATDITFHRKWGDNVRSADQATWCGDTMTDTCDEYAMSYFGTAADQQPKTWNETLAALQAIGAKVFGLSVDGGTTSDQRAELSAFAVRTGAWVAPNAAGQCETGVSGAARPAEMWDPDGAGPEASRLLCPLVFSTTSGGTGVGSGIVSAISNLTSFVSFSTIHTEARDNDATAGVNEEQFFVRGIPVSAVPAMGCSLPVVSDRLPMPMGDGTFDTFAGVCPGTVVTFQIVMQNNVVMPACADQTFTMRVVVIGDDTVLADERTVAIRVPGDTSLCP